VGSARVLTAELGNARAVQGIHPSDSLQAATELFEAALTTFEMRSATTTDGLRDIAVALNRAIMRRVALAAVPYVTFLLKKLHSAHLEERRRIARELHDRVAHGVGVALQNLELSRFYAEAQPDRSSDKVSAAEEALRDALSTLRQVSADLRDSVGDQGLARALGAYLQANVPPHIRTQLSTSGDSKHLPGEVSEELYLVLREAIRNATLHASPGSIQVSLDITDTYAHACVTDDGSGFESGPAASTRTGGLASMRERSELLGGMFAVTASPGAGTRVEVRIPLPRSAL
jgi:signal transduction histidine kinase